MRRFLIWFLILFLPLQASWAAVTGYCQHESGLAAEHLGHHEHEHDSSLTEKTTGKTTPLNPSGATDSDCSFCNANLTAIPSSGAQRLPAPALAALPAKPPPPALTAFGVPPERPDWSSLA